METFRVRMLGGFSISQGDNQIDDGNNRARKVWLLLSYLIYHRRSRKTQEDFLAALQIDSSEIDDPSNRLKALFYRARAQLDQLGDGIGHQLILYKDGHYSWNPEAAMTLDAEEFDTLYTKALATTGQEQLDAFRQLLTIYRGDFLPKLATESWVIPIHAYFHRRYLDVVERTLPLLEEQGLWQEASSVCDQALRLEPYSEGLYQHRMRYLIAAGNRQEAVQTYETMSELLFDTFGVMPSDESRRLYREASKEVSDTSVPPEDLRSNLKESGETKGAVFCEYDFFRLLYQVQARAIIRSGDVVHIALLSIHGAGKAPLARRSLDRAMENLQALAISNLRQGDVVTRCSASQLILMLPQANYENSCMVCQRIEKAFCRQYPHSPARIHYAVHPLEPRLPNA